MKFDQADVEIARGPSSSRLASRAVTKGKQRPQAAAITALGSHRRASLYLDRCQVDTPIDLVSFVWKLVKQRRRRIGKVVDFGAGDGRFAATGAFDEYVGYEIDSARCLGAVLSPNARVINACAFAENVDDADLCIGNPPYVRNQDLPSGWRQRAVEIIKRRTGVAMSGLANAWQYFVFLALASTRPNGLVALVIPFEWVSRPSSASLRQFIKKNKWEVSVYRLRDDRFQRVLTTSSIMLVNKAAQSGRWRFFREEAPGRFRVMRTETGGRRRAQRYSRPSKVPTFDKPPVVAKRGLSPGTQKYLTLTEGERVRCGLRPGVDVVPCVTSLRTLQHNNVTLTPLLFRKAFVDAGRKAWLIRTDNEPSDRLRAYLESVPLSGRKTSTCEARDQWWRFVMPMTPTALMASGFRDAAPKIVFNEIKARAVGGVYGIYGKAPAVIARVIKALRRVNYSERVVSHSHGFRKMEPNQINALIEDLLTQ